MSINYGMFVFLLIILSCASNPPMSHISVVPYIDLNRYTGRWYEIASFPQRFQKGCTDSRAEYRLLPNGDVEVVNSCLRDGRIDQVKGKAWVVDKTTNAKLKVSFFWPFRGDYWIVDLGKNYEYAVISNPSMKYLWILSRSPKMDNTLYQELIRQLKDRGFDVAKLSRTPQGNRKD